MVGHELNSQIFLTIYFCTRFFCDKKFCINIFCVTKFCSFISACVVSLLSKINVQIFVTQTVVIKKNFDAKNDVAKISTQNFLWIVDVAKINPQNFLCETSFISALSSSLQQFLRQKFLRKKFLYNIFFVYLFLQRFILRHIFLYILLK